MKLDWAEIEHTIKYVLIALSLLYKRKRYIIRWFKRKKLKLLPVRFNIALSLGFNEGLNSGNYFSQIKKNLLNMIDDNGLSKQLILGDFSDINRFDSREQAESFRNKKNIDLIIWGEFTNDGLKAKRETITKVNLKFTFGCPDNKNRAIGSMLLLELTSNLAEKNYWQIVENNSLNDIEIVANNIFDISTYIVALTLKLYGRITQSLKLFEHLFRSLNNRSDDFRKKIIPHLLDCYSILIEEYGIKRKNFGCGTEYCKKILQLDKDNFFALADLATFQYKNGDKDAAELSVNLLLEKYPGDPITKVNVAFIRILQKKYNNAYQHYKKLTEKGSIDFNTQEVIEFLGNEFTESREPALLYASGIISYYFGDEKLAKIDLRKFIRLASENKYKPMYRNAKKILNKK